MIGEYLYKDINNKQIYKKEDIISKLKPTKEFTPEEIYNICKIDHLINTVNLRFYLNNGSDISDEMYKYADDTCLHISIQRMEVEKVRKIINYVQVTKDHIISCVKLISPLDTLPVEIFKILLDNYEFLIPKIVKEILLTFKNDLALDLISHKEFELT
jgi:hypothetical protein